jgi:hypothetical protein
MSLTGKLDAQPPNVTAVPHAWPALPHRELVVVRPEPLVVRLVARLVYCRRDSRGASLAQELEPGLPLVADD